MLTSTVGDSEQVTLAYTAGAPTAENEEGICSVIPNRPSRSELTTEER